MAEKKLLLVDDDGLILATMSRELKDAGYQVSVADNGEDGLRQALGDPPDLAILDIRMPGLSGFELADRLRQIDVNAIFLTAYDNASCVEQAATSGALGYLVKPIDIGRAIPTIETALRRSQELRDLKQTAERLDNALDTCNSVNVVIGILMERYQLDRTEAYELIRRKARSERRKVKSVAEEIMDAWAKSTTQGFPHPHHSR